MGSRGAMSSWEDLREGRACEPCASDGAEDEKRGAVGCPADRVDPMVDTFEPPLAVAYGWMELGCDVAEGADVGFSIAGRLDRRAA